jgi:hypothetical protein
MRKASAANVLQQISMPRKVATNLQGKIATAYGMTV